MVDKNENKAKSSSSSASVVSESHKKSHRPLTRMLNEVDGESNCSSKKESESQRSLFINAITKMRNNFFKKRKLLKTWNEFILNKVLYNKDYIYMDKTFCCIEHKTMVRREQIFYAVICLLIALVLLQNFDPLLCAVVSCLYPAYETTKSLTAHKNGEHKQRKHWVIYWIVFSFFTLQDYYTEWLTKLFSPLFLLKMLFLMLLALPQTGVAELCYYDIVVPVLSVVNNAFVKYNWQSNNVAGVTANCSEMEENDQ